MISAEPTMSCEIAARAEAAEVADKLGTDLGKGLSVTEADRDDSVARCLYRVGSVVLMTLKGEVSFINLAAV